MARATSFRVLYQIMRGSMGSRWEPDRVVAVVKLYLDDSGTNIQSPSVLIGGLAARPMQWRRFERSAEPFLTSRGIEVLHAKDFHDRDGPFKGWNREEKLSFARELGALFVEHKCVGCFMAAHKKNYAAARGARTDLPADVSHCLVDLVRHIMADGGLRRFIMTDGLTIAVERGNKNDGGMQHAHDTVLVPKYGDLLRSFALVPKTDSRAIQCADFLAFHVRRHMDEQTRAGKGLPLGDVLRILIRPVEDKRLRFICNFIEDLKFSPASAS
jgi:hypothetical protein